MMDTLQNKINNIAHDLRNPLSVIKMNTELLLLDSSLTDDAKKSFESIIEELNRALEIINKLLTVSIE